MLWLRYGSAVTWRVHRSGALLGPRLSLICFTHSTTALAREGSEELPTAKWKLGSASGPCRSWFADLTRLVEAGKHAFWKSCSNFRKAGSLGLGKFCMLCLR